MFLIFQKKLCPHRFVQPCNTCQILVASGRKTIVIFCCRAFHVSIGYNVCHLGCECNHRVVTVVIADCEFTEMNRRQQFLRALDGFRIIQIFWHKYHRSSVVHCLCAVCVAGKMTACHWVSADKSKAILFGDRVAGLADQLFCTTAVDHHRIFADIRCHLCQIVNAKLRIQTKQNQIAVFDIPFV